MEVFNAIFSSTLSFREEANQKASKNFVEAQEKQPKEYNIQWQRYLRSKIQFG